MAFFYPRTVYHSQPSFTPIFHLFNGRSSQCEPRRVRNTRYVYRQPVRPWLPRFEAKETGDAYVVLGDLPGLSREQVSVEFPEAQKLVIRGTTERRAPQTSNPDQATSEPTSEPAVEAITESTPAPATATASIDDNDDVSSVTTEASQEAKSVSSYQATVEDADDDDFEMVDASPEKPKEQEKKPQAKREEVQPTPEREPSPSPQPQEQAQAPVPAVPELQPAHPEQSRVRRFARTLNFPDGVELDYDAVTADLKDGLLRIVVPKINRSEPRRVAIL
ncbi:unnamed protein product [Clonostachys solani]|uniref:SHSP domain-containing protein n=1 Tax=Clonostachys solani TaxID=160281 RepID=A0A9P0EFY9_9HYPO|nr:unnamed protein product [Clonostachys solani]